MTHVGVHWTTRPAKGWSAVNASDWEFTQKLLEPVGGEIIDAREGYVYGLNVQGVIVRADHYGVEYDPFTRRMTVYHWNDDPDDYAPGEYWGKVWEFDPFVGSLGNTVQRCTIYGGSTYRANLPDAGIQTTAGPCEVLPFNKMPRPREALIRHGIWADEVLVKDLDAFPKANRDDWQEGELLRFSAQTVTYLMNAPDTNDSDCSIATGFSRKLDETGQTNQDLTDTVLAQSTRATHGFATIAGDPNDNDWPIASGGDPYFANWNITAIGADITFEMSSSGFQRINSSCAIQGSAADEQGAFSGTGVHSATNTTWNPSAGSANDRFAVRITATNSQMHANEDITLRTDSNSDAGGPWGGAAPEKRPQMLWVVQEPVDIHHMEL